MYKRVGKASPETIDYLNHLLKQATWKDVIGPEDDFKTWFHDVIIKEFPIYKQAFFLMIPPGGKVHRHKDTAREEKT